MYSKAHLKINTRPNLASKFVDRKVLRKLNKYVSPHTNGNKYFASGKVWNLKDWKWNKYNCPNKKTPSAPPPPLEIKECLLNLVYVWYNNIIVYSKVEICTLTELRHHDHFRSPTMTYLGHQILIQSQQIYFLQRFIFFYFHTIFSHFQENCWNNDENSNLKAFVLVANALWTRDI